MLWQLNRHIFGGSRLNISRSRPAVTLFAAIAIALGSSLAAQAEELADLAPQRTGAGFRGSLSYSVTDLIIL